ncbi:NRDE family protein [Indiicoccus explosivorum]|uniref:NRDE family protein n=1 Tax=Indiicoccus explosivorum TaxID=1917864 RepID=UPI000B42D7A0|nr:NRDE family protein [Indiicoccus explosivorum]
MCLINFQFHNHPAYKLVVAANRDEFYGRPTAAAHFWEDAPHILAGRDLKEKGTWMGITKAGRFAALTNFRDPERETDGKRTRGEIVRNFLDSDMPADAFMRSLDPDAYNGFNLIAGTPDALFYFNNIEGGVQEISPGIHGISNRFLDTPWPKVVKGKAGLAEALKGGTVDPEELFALMQRAEPAADAALPDTGVGRDLERRLSPLFIKMEEYGTRSSTVLTVNKTGDAEFIERTYDAGVFMDEKRFSFRLPS